MALHIALTIICILLNIWLKKKQQQFLDGFRKSTNTYRSNQLLTSSSDEDETLYEKQKLLKPGRKKTRSKNIAPLIDMESEPARSGNEFDGTGLDKTTVVLRGRGSSAEDII